MISYLRLFVLLVCLIFSFINAKAVFAQEQAHDAFPQSFLDCYNLTPEGRYAHEYHSFMRDKTKESFLKLEKSLSDKGFSLDGRLVILGYQEDAVSPYISDFSRVALNDEAIAYNNKGYSPPARNLFGFITGFLFKDVAWMQAKWNKEQSFCHFSAYPLSIFNDNAGIFQKHAFGNANFEAAKAARDEIEKLAYKNNIRSIINCLIEFWTYLYKSGSKNESQEIVATQDILFNIHYAKALWEATTPIKSFFLGPDITYPIEVVKAQEAGATRHAQAFVKFFSSHLSALQNQKTAYVFCSFVDGVGKSTLLNNVKNYVKYGTDLDKYMRCDNSSSQESTIFQLKENVYIADLPGQVSHYTVKPDGHVYADYETVKEFDKALYNSVMQDIDKNKENYILAFNLAKKRAKERVDALYAYPEDTVYSYAQNCIVLSGDDKPTEWVPFVWGKWHLQFSLDNSSKLRILVPLSQAHSASLKTIEPEAMLFSKGMSLPTSLDVFLEKLTTQLKNEGIKRIVFVDFLSMYPRTSRENIRINFLLQYLKQLHKDKFDLQKSFYRHFVNGDAEVFNMLDVDREKITEALFYETALRWSLFKLLDQEARGQLTTFVGAELHNKLQEITTALIATKEDELFEQVAEKIIRECYEKEVMYKQKVHKIYESVVRFSGDPLIEFSEKLCLLFGKAFNENYFKDIWSGLDGELNSLIPVRNEHGLSVYQLDNGTEVLLVDNIHADCRSEDKLTPFVARVRAQWYALLSDLVYYSLSGRLQPFRAPPLVIKKGPDNRLYAVQKYLPIDTSGRQYPLPTLLAPIAQPAKKRHWGMFAELPHCLDWQNNNTYSFYFAYGYIPLQAQAKTTNENQLRKIIAEAKKTSGLSTSELVKFITSQDKNSSLWNKLAAGKEFGGKHKIDLNENKIALTALRLWVRAIATIEVILKDPRADICARKGSKEDFQAAVILLEKITTSFLFGQCSEPLFDNYDAIEPFIDWKYLK